MTSTRRSLARRLALALTCAASIGTAGTGLAGCRASKASADPDPRPVRIAPVEPAPAAPAVRYSANVVPETQVPVAFKVGGYIDSILQRPGADKRPRDVQQGDLASEGTVLARVSQADYSARVDQAHAGVTSAEAALTKAQADFDRADRLFAVQSLTKPDLDAARAARDAAVSRLDSAKAEAALADIALRDTELKMPLNGVILERRIERGALVAPGSVGLTVGNMRSVKAVFGVPDVIAPQMTLGTPLPIRTDAIPNRDFPGRVSAVAPVADPQSRVFNIEITVPNPDQALRPGMVATVEVRQGNVQRTATSPGAKPLTASAAEAAPQPAVPLAAVVKQGQGAGGYAVFIVEGSGDKTIARARPITLGEVAGNTVAVSSGVRVGDRVIVSGATFVQDGEPVRIVP